MDIAELSRLLANLIRIGTIHSIDHAAKRCRVQIGENTTRWLPWIERRAGTTRTWDPPTMGEQCVVLSPSGELAGGIVLLGLPSDENDTPSHAPEKHVIRFPDGATFSYDHATSHLDISGIKSSTVDAENTLLFKAGESVTFDSPLVHNTGKHKVDDLFTYGNGMAGTGGDNGNTISGPVNHQGAFTNTGSMSSNGIVLDQHHHAGVLKGGDESGGPV